MTTFNYAAFKAEWRAGCARHGIDPETGATSYQAAIVKAETIKAQRRRRIPGEPDADTALMLAQWAAQVSDFYRSREIFGELDRVEWSLIRSTVDAAARLAGRRQRTYAVVEEIDLDTVSLIDLCDLWQEVRRELIDEITPRQRAWLPSAHELREMVVYG